MQRDSDVQLSHTTDFIVLCFQKYVCIECFVKLSFNKGYTEEG